MRALVQRVASAAVQVDAEIVGSIGKGLCVFVGVAQHDDAPRAERLAEKLWNLRIFEDEGGRINLSAAQLSLPVLVVSQFSLYADTSKGRRPSFVEAADPMQAEPLVEVLTDQLRSSGAQVATGLFRAHMVVTLSNDGPLTVLVET